MCFTPKPCVEKRNMFDICLLLILYSDADYRSAYTVYTMSQVIVYYVKEARFLLIAPCGYRSDRRILPDRNKSQALAGSIRNIDEVMTIYAIHSTLVKMVQD